MNYIKKESNRPTEEWRELRRKGIGSSDAAVILGLNPYKTPLELYLEKIGEKPAEQEETLKLKFGIEVEPLIARMFEEKTGLIVRNDFKMRLHPQYPFIFANLDRTIVSHNDSGPGILEIKTASEAYQKTWEDEVPPNYYVQIQHQMAVTGYKYGYFAILFMGYTGIKDFMVIEVKRDDGFINDVLLPQLIDFWTNHVEKYNPPAPSNTDDLKILYPTTTKDKVVDAQDAVIEAINRLKEIKTQLEPLEEEKKKLEEQIKLAFLDAEVLTYNGEIVATYKQTKDMLKFDQKKFEAENPELAQKYFTIIPGYRRLIIK